MQYYRTQMNGSIAAVQIATMQHSMLYVQMP